MCFPVHWHAEHARSCIYVKDACLIPTVKKPYKHGPNKDMMSISILDWKRTPLCGESEDHFTQELFCCWNTWLESFAYDMAHVLLRILSEYGTCFRMVSEHGTCFRMVSEYGTCLGWFQNMAHVLGWFQNMAHVLRRFQHMFWDSFSIWYFLW